MRLATGRGRAKPSRLGWCDKHAANLRRQEVFYRACGDNYSRLTRGLVRIFGRSQNGFKNFCGGLKILATGLLQILHWLRIVVTTLKCLQINLWRVVCVQGWACINTWREMVCIACIYIYIYYVRVCVCVCVICFVLYTCFVLSSMN